MRNKTQRKAFYLRQIARQMLALKASEEGSQMLRVDRHRSEHVLVKRKARQLIEYLTERVCGTVRRAAGVILLTRRISIGERFGARQISNVRAPSIASLAFGAFGFFEGFLLAFPAARLVAHRRKQLKELVPRGIG